MDRQLRILVTGAGRGIGKAIVSQLKSDPLKHKIAVTARTESELKEVVSGALGETLVIAADATSTKVPDEVIAKMVAAWGGVDVIILNAGEADVQKIEDTTDAIWEKTLAINTTAPFRFIRAVTPVMKSQNYGRVIVIASIAGLMGEAFVTAYSASKHAVVGVVRASAVELSKYGITVNALCPGYVDTPMLDKGLDVTAARTGKTRDELRAALAAKQPGGRLLTANEVATAAIAFIDNGETGEARWLDAATIGEKK
ncbi:MAG: SDR family NAD(P)-dependent oxidoreductase [Actinobacteria bacterium]|nr:SDR family NAD(P)-dependent oxidoreductase [Actinomycetota bacterium]